MSIINNEELLKKPEIILITKKDLVDEKELNKKIKQLKSLDRKILTYSIYDEKSIEELRATILSTISK